MRVKVIVALCAAIVEAHTGYQPNTGTSLPTFDAAPSATCMKTLPHITAYSTAHITTHATAGQYMAWKEIKRETLNCKQSTETEHTECDKCADKVDCSGTVSNALNALWGFFKRNQKHEEGMKKVRETMVINLRRALSKMHWDTIRNCDLIADVDKKDVCMYANVQVKLLEQHDASHGQDVQRNKDLAESFKEYKEEWAKCVIDDIRKDVMSYQQALEEMHDAYRHAFHHEAKCKEALSAVKLQPLHTLDWYKTRWHKIRVDLLSDEGDPKGMFSDEGIHNWGKIAYDDGPYSGGVPKKPHEIDEAWDLREDAD